MEVPLELTDFRADRTWAASHQMDHVKRFARDLKAGKKVDPVVAVALPDHRHVRIIDGHHRAMACKKLGWPVRMWIGHVDSKATRDAGVSDAIAARYTRATTRRTSEGAAPCFPRHQSEGRLLSALLP